MPGESVLTASLAGWLSTPICSRIAERGLFSAPFVRYKTFLRGAAFMVETGAVLGRARHEDAISLLSLFVNNPAQALESCNAQTDSLKRFASDAELMPTPSLLISLYLHDLSAHGTDPHSSSWNRNARTILGTKLEPETASLAIETYTYIGLAFGIHFPDLVAYLYRNDHEQAQAVLSQAKRLGLDIPKLPGEFTGYALSERESDLLAMVGGYARLYTPQLVEPLRLPAPPASWQTGRR